MKLDRLLTIYKQLDSLSSPQKCKVQQNKLEYPATSVVVLTCDENRRFLCKLYYLSENYDDKNVAFVDDSVEIGTYGNLDEIKAVNEIQLVDEEIVKFDNVLLDVELEIEELNLDIIKCTESLGKVINTVLKHYVFTSNCSISCHRFGISKIHVKLTDKEQKIGSISDKVNIKVSQIYLKSHSNIHYKSLGGLSDAEKSLEDLIDLNLDYSRNVKKFTFKPGNQALIVGPVGSGKTSLIHNAAKKFSCITFEISGDIFKPFPGETEETVLGIFNKIKFISKLVGKGQLIIVIIENVEVFCPRFNPKMKENSHTSRISSLMFSMLDEISESKLPLMVIGTTSKLETMDDAVRRATRLGNCEIVIEMPNEIQRKEIITRVNEQLQMEISPQLLEFVAQSTPGFVGADLENLCVVASRDNCDLQTSLKNALKSVIPTVMRENLGLLTRSSLTLDDIGGMNELKNVLRTSVLGPLRHPEKFHKLGLHSPSGILLYGPSGCAKTTIVKCLAGESKMTLISVSSAEIYSPYVGEAEKFLVKLFNQARMNAPTILFFDEIDTIVGNRSISGGTNDSHMRILSTLLTEIDGFGTGDKKTVLVIGATNKPQMIDDALLRPGRFDKMIHVPAPDLASRKSILSHLLRKAPVTDDVDVEVLSERTENFSGADLENLCNEAAMCAATRDLAADKITKKDFEDVLTYLRPSLTRQRIEFYETYGRNK